MNPVIRVTIAKDHSIQVDITNDFEDGDKPIVEVWDYSHRNPDRWATAIDVNGVLFERSVHHAALISRRDLEYKERQPKTGDNNA